LASFLRIQILSSGPKTNKSTKFLYCPKLRSDLSIRRSVCGNLWSHGCQMLSSFLGQFVRIRSVVFSQPINRLPSISLTFYARVFRTKFWSQSQNVPKKGLSYEKSRRNTLMKLTPDIRTPVRRRFQWLFPPKRPSDDARNRRLCRLKKLILWFQMPKYPPTFRVGIKKTSYENFVRFFLTLSRKILILLRLKVVFEADIIKRWY